MTNEKIATMLRAHGVPYYIREGRIFADSMTSGTARFEIVNELTGCSGGFLLAWLGY